MRLKGLFISKPFIVTALALSVVGILAVCIYFNIDRNEVFEPDADTSASVTESWSETKPPSSDLQRDIPEDDPDAYPKVMADGDDSTEIDFAPVDVTGQEPPPAPSTTQDNTDPNSPPSYAESATAPPKTDNGPAPGSANDKGQIWDPVFGWITPGDGVGAPVDNGGDPDKQVGDM